MLALQRSGSACTDTGWSPSVFTLHRDGQLHAACAGYLKSHSYGEYVFDWAWAEAYERHGLPYYPKLLAAVPFTPVPGTRLLALDDQARIALIQALEQSARSSGLSSAHVLFVDETDAAALKSQGWMLRHGVQFHWQQETEQPLESFEDLLARMHRDKRKKIQQERRKVAQAGVSFRALKGREISEDWWDFFHACYSITYRQHRSTPYLTRAFFSEMAAHMSENWLLFVAQLGEMPVACSLIALDPQRRVAYGRYWGATTHIPCLHFEACYYQPLAWCIENHYQRFEGGAQGEHKMARGLLPVGTTSAHWIGDARFADAVDDFLKREGAHVDAYVDELRERTPFKANPLSSADDDALSGP